MLGSVTVAGAPPKDAVPVGTEPDDQLLEVLKETFPAFAPTHVAFWAWAGVVASAAMAAVDISSDAPMSAKERGTAIVNRLGRAQIHDELDAKRRTGEKTARLRKLRTLGGTSDIDALAPAIGPLDHMVLIRTLKRCLMTLQKPSHCVRQRRASDCQSLALPRAVPARSAALKPL
jgi:hypothetical protein